MTDTVAQKIVHVHLPKNEAFKTTLTAGNHELIADARHMHTNDC